MKRLAIQMGLFGEKHVPLTDEQIQDVALACAAGNAMSFVPTFARAIEAAHGIGSKP